MTKLLRFVLLPVIHGKLSDPWYGHEALKSVSRKLDFDGDDIPDQSYFRKAKDALGDLGNRWNGASVPTKIGIGVGAATLGAGLAYSQRETDGGRRIPSKRNY